MSRCSCRSAFSQLEDLNRWPWSVGLIFWTRCTRSCSTPVGTYLVCHFPYSRLRNAMTLTTFPAVRQERLCIFWMKFYFFFSHISAIGISSISRSSLVLCIGSSICITCSQSLWKRIQVVHWLIMLFSFFLYTYYWCKTLTRAPYYHIRHFETYKTFLRHVRYCKNL